MTVTVGPSHTALMARLSLLRILPVFVALTLVVAASACTSDEPSSADGGVPAALADGEFALPERDDLLPDGTWAGRVEETDAFVAIVSGPDGVIAYVCDDEAIGEWFRSDVGGDATQLTGNDGLALSAAADGDDLVGTVRLADLGVVSFRAEPAGDDALHRTFGFDEEDMATVGWVTLPSGERRGTISSIGRRAVASVAARRPVVTPAPPLTPREPVSIPKLTPGQVVTLTLPPPTPMTPDVVGAPTANRTQFVWTALGDSYASGEGAPVRPGGFGLGVALPDWGPAVGDVSLDERQSCHRSTKAGAPLANDALRREFPEVTFQFAHYACSGATTFDIMNAGYDGPDRSRQVPQPAQGERAAQFARTHGSYDAVYLSIGGNDAGFGDAIVACLGSASCHEDQIMVEGVPIEQRLSQLPTRYRELDAYLRSPSRSARPGRILLSKNPDPTIGDGGVTCGDGNGRSAGDLLALVSPAEAAWAREVVLEGGMNQAIQGTEALGWTVVDGHLEAFRNHGFCADDNFINTNTTALAQQGDDYDLPGARETVIAFAFVAGGLAGSFAAPVTAVISAIIAANAAQLSAGVLHPNQKGFAAYGDAITQDLRPLVEAKLASGLVPPARVRVASAVNNNRMTVRWNDLSTSEDRYEVMVTRLEGTGSVPSGVVRLPAGAQELEIVSNGPVAVKVEVKACVRSTCSQPGVVEGANFVPKTPTGGTGGYVAVVTGPPLNRTTVSANAGWLPSTHALQYVIEYRQITPASSTVRRMTPNAPIAGLAIADPAFASQGSPKALYGVKISACNRAGCSAFSPEVQVDARNAAEVVTLSASGPALKVPLAGVLLDDAGRVTVGLTAPAMPGGRPTLPGSPPTTFP